MITQIVSFITLGEYILKAWRWASHLSFPSKFHPSVLRFHHPYADAGIKYII